MKKVIPILFAFIAYGCDSKSDTKTEQHEYKNKASTTKLEIAYDGPISLPEFNQLFGGGCSSGTCIVETTPDTAPLKKSTKESICIAAKYERNAIFTAYFSRENIEGALCEISKADYESIITSYGSENIHNKYLNQRSREDFLTWKTSNGYITTFKEILGRDPNGNTMFSYYVYTGSVEHRHYSKYIAN